MRHDPTSGAVVIMLRSLKMFGMSDSMTSPFVLDALEQACWQRKPFCNKSLAHHSDRYSQYLPIKYTERLADVDVDPSVGSVGDSHDNALDDSVIGLFKAEVIKQLGPWKAVQKVEWENMRRVEWYNTERLQGPIGHIPPAEAERRNPDQARPMDNAA